jgi:hypothetical protein
MKFNEDLSSLSSCYKRKWLLSVCWPQLLTHVWHLDILSMHIDVFFFNFLLEIGWQASPGKFRLNWWHYLKELLKNITNRHKCDNIFSEFFFSIIFRDLFFEKKLWKNILLSKSYVNFWWFFTQKNWLMYILLDMYCLWMWERRTFNIKFEHDT